MKQIAGNRSSAKHAWLLLSAALAAGAVAGSSLPVDSLAWQRQVPWDAQRLWTAALTHWSGTHLWLNLGALVLVALLGHCARLPPRAALAWLVAIPGTHALLWWAGEISVYAGMSGVIHAGVTVVAAFLLRMQGALRVVGIGLAAGLTLKVALEAPWLAALQESPEWGFRVATAAHATGVLSGLSASLILVPWTRRRPSTPV